MSAGCACKYLIARRACRLGRHQRCQDSALVLRATVTQHASQSAQVMVATLPETKISSLARTAHAQSYGRYSRDLLLYFDGSKHSRSIKEIATAIVDLVRANSRE